MEGLLRGRMQSNMPGAWPVASTSGRQIHHQFVHSAPSSWGLRHGQQHRRASAALLGPECGRPRRHRAASLLVRAERKEFYDYKDMPPLPLTVSRISVPSLGVTVVDKSTEERRMASLAIFYDIYKDEQYGRRLTRKSAITALCMYDRDDVSAAQASPGDFPNIDLLNRVINQGLDLEFEVEEVEVR